MIQLKQRNRLGDGSRVLRILIEWQRFCFNAETLPNDEDINLFLLMKYKSCDEAHVTYLKKWRDTRQNRDYLTVEQIKDWFEFYYD